MGDGDGTVGLMRLSLLVAFIDVCAFLGKEGFCCEINQ